MHDSDTILAWQLPKFEDLIWKKSNTAETCEVFVSWLSFFDEKSDLWPKYEQFVLNLDAKGGKKQENPEKLQNPKKQENPEICTKTENVVENIVENIVEKFLLNKWENWLQDKENEDFLDQFLEKSAAWWETELKQFLTEKQADFGTNFWPLRVALSGLAKSPSPFELLPILRPAEIIFRLKSCQELFEKSA